MADQMTDAERAECEREGERIAREAIAAGFPKRGAGTTPAEREALRLMAEAANHREPAPVPSREWTAWKDAQINVAINSSMILRLLSDLAAAGAQIAQAKREGMLEAAEIEPTPPYLTSAQEAGYRRALSDYRTAIRSAAGAEPFPQPRRKPGGEPCGECHIQPGETCDICGAVRPSAEGGRDAQVS